MDQIEDSGVVSSIQLNWVYNKLVKILCIKFVCFKHFM